MKHSSLTVFIVSLLFVLGTAPELSADDFEWIGGGGTLSWSAGANWNKTAGGGGQTYPGELGAGDTAIFPNGNTVTLTNVTANTLSALTIGAGDVVTLADQALTLSTDALTVDGTLDTSDGSVAGNENSISVTNDASVAGTLDATADNSTLTVGGNLTVSGTASATGSGSDVTVDGSLTVTGTYENGNNTTSIGGDFDYETAATVSILGTLQFPDLAPDPSTITIGSGTIGDLQIDGGETVVVSDPGSNGPLSLAVATVDGTLRIDSANPADLDVGDLLVAGTLDLQNVAQVNSDATVDFRAAGTLNGNGATPTIVFDGVAGQTFFPAGVNAGDVQVASGTVTQSGTGIARSLTTAGGTTYALDGSSGAVTLEIANGGSITNNGTFQVADSTNTVTLREESGAGTFTFSGNDIDENGNTINLARVSYSPAVALAGAESIVLDDTSTFSNSITVDGTFDTQAQTLSAAGQTLTVNGTGELVMADGGAVDVGAFTSTGTVTNPGAGSTLITASGDVAVSGTFTNPTINTLTMTGAGTTLDGDAGTDLGNVTIDTTATVGLTDTLSLAGDLVIDGELNAAGNDILLGGNWVNNNGAAPGFTPGVGQTVTFNGAAAQQVTTGDVASAFNNLTSTSPDLQQLDELFVNGNLDVTGDLTQGGNALQVVGTTTVAAGGNDLDLSVATNDFQSAVDVSTTGPNNISIADANDLLISASAGNDLTATAAGALTTNGNISAGGSATLTANNDGGADEADDLTVAHQVDSTSTSLVASGTNADIVVNADINNTSGGITLTSGDLIEVNSSFQAVGTADSDIVFSAGSNVQLGADAVITVNNDAASDILFQAGSSINDDGSNRTLTLSAQSGTVRLPPTGQANGTGAVTVTADTLDIRGSATTDAGGVDFSGVTNGNYDGAYTIDTSTGGGNIALPQVLTDGADAALTLNAGGGTISMSEATLTNGGNSGFVFNGGGLLVLDGNITQQRSFDTSALADGDSIEVAGDSVVTVNAGDILTTGENINDDAAAGTNNLTLDASGTVRLQSVGNSEPIASLTVTGDIVQLQGPITTVGDVDVTEDGGTDDLLTVGNGITSNTGNITLTAQGALDITGAVEATSGTITATADSDDDSAAHDLDVSADVRGTAVTLQTGGAGNASVVVSGNTANTIGETVFQTAASVELGGNVTTQGGALTFNASANTVNLVGAARTLDTTNGGVAGTGADIDFTTTAIEDDGGNEYALVLDAGSSGVISIENAGQIDTLDTITFNEAGELQLSGDIDVSANIAFGNTNDVTLTADASVESSGGSVDFSGAPVDSSTGNNYALTATAGTTLTLSATGQNDALSQLTASGATVVFTGSVTATGLVDIDGTADNLMNITDQVTSTTGNIDIGNRGAITVSADVTAGGTASLTGDTNDSAGQNLVVNGGNIEGTTVTLQAGSAAGNGSDVVVDTPLDNTAGSIVVDAGAAMVVNANVRADTNAGDDVTISIPLEVDTTATVSAGNVLTLSGAGSAASGVGGGEGLTLSATTVDLGEVDNAGGALLDQLDVNATNLNLNNGTVTVGGDVLWDGVTGSITPTVSPVLVDTSTGNGAITFQGATLDDGAATRIVNFDAGAGGTGGTITFGTVTMSTGGSGIGIDDAGALEFSGNITTDNGLDFSTNVPGGDNATLLADTVITSNGGDIDFAQTNVVNISGSHALELDGDTVHLGGVGAFGTNPTSLTVTAATAADLYGSLQVDGTIDFTAAAATSLQADITVDSSGGGNTLFQGSDISGTGRTVDFDAGGANDITLSQVGVNGSELGGVTFNSANDLALYGDVFTGGGLNFANAATVSLPGGDVTVETDSDGGNVDFGGTPLDGTAGFSADAGAGDISFSAVGQSTALSFVTASCTGTCTLNGDIQTDGGDIDLTGCADVELATEPTITLDTELGDNNNAGAVLFAAGSAVDSVATRALEVDTGVAAGNHDGGNVSLGSVGSNDAVGGLTVASTGSGTGGDGTVTLNGDISTNGTGIDLSGSSTVSLAATLDMNTTAGGIDLGSTDSTTVTGGGGVTLTLNSAAAIELDDLSSGDVVIGSGTSLGLRGTLQATAGDLDFSNLSNGDSIDIFADSVINASGAVTTTGERINGAFNLQIVSGGAATLQQIGNSTWLQSLDVDSGGQLSLNGNISVDGGDIDLTGSADVELTASVTLDTEVGDDENAGSVLFDAAGTLDSATNESLTVNTNVTGGGFDGGAVQFGNVGTNDALSALTTRTAGDTGGGGTDGTATLNGDLTLSGQLQVANGIFDLTTGAVGIGSIDVPGTSVLRLDGSDGGGGVQPITIGGTSPPTPANFDTDSGTVIYYNSGITPLALGTEYNNLEFESGNWTLVNVVTVNSNMTVTGGIVTLSADLNVGTDATDTLAIAGGGTLSAGTQTITLYGNWDNQGTFNEGSSLVDLEAPNNSTVSITGDTEFFQFRRDTGDLIIEFGAGDTISIAPGGTFEMRGTGPANIELPAPPDPATYESGASNDDGDIILTIPGTPVPPPAPPQWIFDPDPSATIVLEFVFIDYSNALIPIVLPPDNLLGLYNTNWLADLPVTSSATEDSDQNGRIDRIRVVLPAAHNNNFSGFEVRVNGYTVTGVGPAVPGEEFLIQLREKPYLDTDSRPEWEITQNTTLFDNLTNTRVVVIPAPPATPDDAAPPILAHTLTYPGANEIFVKFSEPVYQDHGSTTAFTNGDFTISSGQNVTSVVPITTGAPGEPNAYKELLLDLDSPIDVADITAPETITLGSLPFEDIVGNDSTSGSVTEDGVVSVSSLAIAPESTPIVTPVFARDETIRSPESGGAGLIRDFDGSEFLAPEDITLQAFRDGALGSVPDLHGDSGVSSSLSINGFWLPYELPGLTLGANSGAADFGGSAAAGQLSDHFLPGSNSRIRNETFFEFVFDTGVTIEIGNDQTHPLYSARLATELSTPWYRNVRPWSFELRELFAQRGNVTITSNVINPNQGDRATLNYVLDSASMVRVNVFNVAGDLIDILQSGRQEAGEHSLTWDGTNRQGHPVARGIYFIRVMADGIDEYRKVMVVK